MLRERERERKRERERERDAERERERDGRERRVVCVLHLCIACLVVCVQQCVRVCCVAVYYVHARFGTERCCTGYASARVSDAFLYVSSLSVD
jgi:hypothetical protein